MLSKIVFICMVLGITIAVPVPTCHNEKRLTQTPWELRPNYCGVRDSDLPAMSDTDKIRHYRALERKIGRIYDHTLEYGSGDLEELHKWRYQFEFLPKIDHANNDKDYHKHLQIFAATFHFMKNVQNIYHIQKFSSQFEALEKQAFRLLCEIENDPTVEWEEISMEEVNQFMCQFRLGDKDKENQSHRNARFTQMLFRQYLLGLRAQIMSKVVNLEINQ